MRAGSRSGEGWCTLSGRRFQSSSPISHQHHFPHYPTPVRRYDAQRVVQQLQGLAAGDVVTWGGTGWEGGLQEEGQREHAAGIEGGGITG